MSETVLSTQWEFYDSERHKGLGGNYIFLLKAFHNAPYYSGETRNFADRFTKNGRSHRILFAGGHRTFMRQPFIDEATDQSHAGFAARWHHYKQQPAEERDRLVWVGADRFNSTMGQEGATFWDNEVTLLVSPTDDIRRTIEKRVQVDIMNYYDGLVGNCIDWCIPPRSRLVGHGPGVVTEPTVVYRLGEGMEGDAGTFFGSLAM